MSFLGKLAGAASSAYSSMERNYERQTNKIQSQYDYVSRSARSKSDAELRAAFKNSTDSVEKKALYDEHMRRQKK